MGSALLPSKCNILFCIFSQGKYNAKKTLKKNPHTNDYAGVKKKQHKCDTYHIEVNHRTSLLTLTEKIWNNENGCALK